MSSILGYRINLRIDDLLRIPLEEQILKERQTNPGITNSEVIRKIVEKGLESFLDKSKIPAQKIRLAEDQFEKLIEVVSARHGSAAVQKRPLINEINIKDLPYDEPSLITKQKSQEIHRYSIYIDHVLFEALKQYKPIYGSITKLTHAWIREFLEEQKQTQELIQLPVKPIKSRGKTKRWTYRIPADLEMQLESSKEQHGTIPDIVRKVLWAGVEKRRKQAETKDRQQVFMYTPEDAKSALKRIQYIDDFMNLEHLLIDTSLIKDSSIYEHNVIKSSAEVELSALLKTFDFDIVRKEYVIGKLDYNLIKETDQDLFDLPGDMRNKLGNLFGKEVRTKGYKTPHENMEAILKEKMLNSEVLVGFGTHLGIKSTDTGYNVDKEMDINYYFKLNDFAYAKITQLKPGTTKRKFRLQFIYFDEAARDMDQALAFAQEQCVNVNESAINRIDEILMAEHNTAFIYGLMHPTKQPLVSEVNISEKPLHRSGLRVEKSALVRNF